MPNPTETGSYDGAYPPSLQEAYAAWRAASKAKPSDESMDAVHDVLARSAASSKPEQRRRPAVWLDSCRKNRLVDLAREAETYIRRITEYVRSRGTVRSTTATASEIASETALRVVAAIRALPFVQRRALLLRDWRGLDNSAVAQILFGEVTIASRAAVSRLACAARLALQAALVRDLGEDAAADALHADRHLVNELLCKVDAVDQRRSPAHPDEAEKAQPQKLSRPRESTEGSHA